MANILTFTPQKIKELREEALGNLYLFQKGVWGDKDLEPDVHGSLCQFLERPGFRKGICGWRGSLKSSSFRAWIVQMGLKHLNWSFKLVEQREDNAKEHHRMLQDKFRYGPQAGLLQEMFADRLLMDQWTTEKTVFLQTDPNAHPFLTHAGLTSRLESAHHDGIGGDDLEGADAEISDAPNKESERFVLNRAWPLLREPESCHIVVAGTPHGKDPLMWKLRDIAVEQEKQDPGNPLNWQVWWKEIVNSQGEPRWPKRFSMNYVNTLKSAAKISTEARRLFDMQYMLRRSSAGSGFFDVDSIRAGNYTIVPNTNNRLLSYPVREFEDELLDPKGFFVEKEAVRKTIDLAHCRPYIHLDPLHKDPEDRENAPESMWAILVTMVSPDFHTFLIDCWLEDASFDQAFEQLFLFYRKYAPYRITIDPVGAQTWIKHFLRQGEKQSRYRRMMSLPTTWAPVPRRLPAPSAVTVEADAKKNREKEPWILEQLELQFNMQWLHLHSKFEEMFTQLGNVGTGSGFMDGPDALAQGPAIWQPPVSNKLIEAMKKRKRVQELMNVIEPVTGYVRRFKDEAA